MSRIILSFTLGLILFAITIQAQSDIRIYLSNNQFNKVHFKGAEEKVISVFKDISSQTIKSTVKTLLVSEQVPHDNTFRHILGQLRSLVADGEGVIFGFYNKFVRAKSSLSLR